MKTLAVIDMGSNSIRLVVVQIKSHSYKFLDDIKETVRLEQGLDKQGYISEEKIKQTLQCLRMFKELCLAHQVTDTICVATAAIRKAKNSNELAERAKNETGIDLRIISGAEEAEYVFNGVACSMDIDDSIIIDIGGGSIEIIEMDNKKPVNKVSLPFGSIDLCTAFQLDDIVDQKKESKLFDYINSELKKLDWLKKANNKPVIGVGGIARNIGKISRRKSNYPIDLVHCYPLDLDEIIGIYNGAKKLDAKNRKGIKGLSSNRTDIFVGACATIIALMKHIQSEEMLISGSGLREGLIYDYLQKENIMDFDDVLAASIGNLTANYAIDRVHSKHICNIMNKLFNELQDIHRLERTPSIEKIIEVSSLFHDFGITLQYYHHHMHGFYMLLNSGINGLTQYELMICSLIVSNHRIGKLKNNFRQYKPIIDEKASYIIYKLAILLQISESLDRSRLGKIGSIHCTIDKDAVTIWVASQYDIELEISKAIEVQPLFEKHFEKKLNILKV